MNANTLRHVRHFLEPADPAGAVATFVKDLTVVNKNDSVISEVLNVAVGWIETQKILLSKRVSDTGSRVERDHVVTLLGLWFMRFDQAVRQERLSTSGTLRMMGRGGVASFHRFAATVEDDFLSELLRVALKREQEAPDFAMQLEAGRVGVRQVASRIRSDQFASDAAASPELEGPSTDSPTLRIDDDDVLGAIVLAAIAIAAYTVGFVAGKGNPRPS